MARSLDQEVDTDKVGDAFLRVWSDGGFTLAGVNSGKIFDPSFPPCAFCSFFNILFMEISWRRLIPLFKPGSVHSGLAN